MASGPRRSTAIFQASRFFFVFGTSLTLNYITPDFTFSYIFCTYPWFSSSLHSQLRQLKLQFCSTQYDCRRNPHPSRGGISRCDPSSSHSLRAHCLNQAEQRRLERATRCGNIHRAREPSPPATIDARRPNLLDPSGPQ